MTSKTKYKNDNLKDHIRSLEEFSNEDMVYKAGELIRETEEVDVDEAYLNVQKRISAKTRIVQIYTVVSRYAAILVFPLIIFLVWALLNLKESAVSEQIENELSMQEITCPVGMRSNVILPDGSKVWLNAESSIKYALPFIQEKRSVELKGEAFLDVAKNKNVPFEIRSGNVKVDVVGTRFNFKSYAEDNTVSVTLEEGKVNLNLLAGEGKSSSTEMLPGDHFELDRSTGKATVVNRNVEPYLGWKENKLIFDDTPMPEMVKILERWYGVDIEITDETVGSYKFTTTFENEPLSQVLELLELSSPIKLDYFPGKADKKTNEIIKSKIKISKKN